MKLVHERVLLQHTPHRERQSDGHGCGQPLGDSGDRDGDGGEEHIQHVLAADNARYENQHANANAYRGKRPAKLAQFLLQRGLLLCDLGHHLRDTAHLRLAAQRDRLAARLSL